MCERVLAAERGNLSCGQDAKLVCLAPAITCEAFEALSGTVELA